MSQSSRCDEGDVFFFSPGDKSQGYGIAYILTGALRVTETRGKVPIEQDSATRRARLGMFSWM
jgi:hypothetical protein